MQHKTNVHAQMKSSFATKIGLVLGLSVLLAWPALAQQTVNETKPTGSTPWVKITHINGEVTVQAWDRNEVRVIGKLGDNTEEFIFEANERTVTIELESKKKQNWFNWNSDYSANNDDELEIMVPKGSEINYDSVNGSISVAGTSGGVDLEVVNGSVKVVDIEGRMRLSTVNGPIIAENVKGDLDLGSVNGSISAVHLSDDDVKVETVNGEVRLTSPAHDVVIETVNGGIKLDLSAVNRLNIETVNSRVNTDLNLLDGGKVTASSVGGGMTFAFQKDVSARFEVDGHAGGSIRNSITDDKMEKAKYGPSRSLNFTTGSGAGKVQIETVNGSIKLETQ